MEIGNLIRYIKGWEVSKKSLYIELKSLPKCCLYTGILYKGVRCGPEDIYEDICTSWTTSLEVAALFAGKGGTVLKKSGSGIDIQKVKKYYNLTCGNKYEREVISDLKLKEIKVIKKECY